MSAATAMTTTTTTTTTTIATPQTTTANDDAKSKRYDRQLRIWGSAGQARLESARVCLLGAGPTGTESLKNLVLGGVSAYTIVDGLKVSARDLGNNFLLDRASLGTSRAECSSKLIQEFNESASASYVAETPEHVIDTNPDFFRDFALVIATQLAEPYQAKLDAVCRAFDVPIVFGRVHGLLGSVRVSAREHCVVDSKPDNAIDDLRIGAPWPALAAYASRLDLATLDDVTLRHVPYVVLLIKAAARWREAHGGAAPATRQEQRAFKQAIASLALAPPAPSPSPATAPATTATTATTAATATPMEEAPVAPTSEELARSIAREGENFREARDNAYHVWKDCGLESDTKSILAQSEEALARCGAGGEPGAGGGGGGGGGAGGQQGRHARAKFWVLVESLRRFVGGNGGLPPLAGALPDMTATTDLYLDLKRLYTEKHEQDAAQVVSGAPQLPLSLSLSLFPLSLSLPIPSNLSLHTFSTLSSHPATPHLTPPHRPISYAHASVTDDRFLLDRMLASPFIAPFACHLLSINRS